MSETAEAELETSVHVPWVSISKWMTERDSQHESYDQSINDHVTVMKLPDSDFIVFLRLISPQS